MLNKDFLTIRVGFCFLAIVLYFPHSFKVSANTGKTKDDISYNLEISPEKDRVEFSLHNTTGEYLRCELAFIIGLENIYARTVGARAVVLNSLIVLPWKEHKFSIQFKDIPTQSDAIQFTELQGKIQKASCISREKTQLWKYDSKAVHQKRNPYDGADDLYKTLETALRLNAIDYLNEIISDFKVTTFSHSSKNSSHPIILKDVFNLNNSFFRLDQQKIQKILPGIKFLEIYGTNQYKEKVFDGDHSCKNRKSHLCGYIYNISSSSECGVYIDNGQEQYKRCRLKQHGVEDVKSCKLRLTKSLEVKRC